MAASPRKWVRNRKSALGSLEIPVPDAPGRAVVTPPAGAYQIGVCSREELGKLGLTNVQLKEPAKAGRRSFEFHLGQKIKEVDHNSLSQATITYQVTAR